MASSSRNITRQGDSFPGGKHAYHIVTLYRCDSSVFVYTDPVLLIRASLGEMKLDESFQLPSSANKACLATADLMLADTHSLADRTVWFCQWLINELVLIINQSLSKKGTVKQGVLWPKLHFLQGSDYFKQKWMTYLSSINANPAAIFYQHLTRFIFGDLLKKKFAVNETTDIGPSDEPLTFEEENSIYYVGGYVVRQLKAHEADAELIHGLDHLQFKEQDDQCEAAVWTNTINRGGLIQISKEAQQAFVAIENAVRRHLVLDKAHTMDETARTKLRKYVFADDDVQFQWCLTGMCNEIGDE